MLCDCIRLQKCPNRLFFDLDDAAITGRFPSEFHSCQMQPEIQHVHCVPATWDKAAALEPLIHCQPPLTPHRASLLPSSSKTCKSDLFGGWNRARQLWDNIFEAKVKSPNQQQFLSFTKWWSNHHLQHIAAASGQWNSISGYKTSSIIIVFVSKPVCKSWSAVMWV